MIRKLFYIFLVLAIFSCKNQTLTDEELSLIKANDSLITKIFSKPIYWQKELKKIDEPNLINTTDKEIYRLTLNHSMFGYKDVYKLIRDSNNITLITKIYDKEYIKDDLKIYLKESKKRVLNISEWNDFLKVIKKSNYWMLPVTKKTSGFDGTTWILEGVTPSSNNYSNRKYHLVSRWSPNDTTKFRVLCDKLIRLSEN